MKYLTLLALLVGGCAVSPPDRFESVYPVYDGGDVHTIYDLPQSGHSHAEGGKAP